MSLPLPVSSLSEIGPVDKLPRLSNGLYATLPVVVLALAHINKQAFLLVTDFTAHPQSGFALGNLPPNLPKEHVIGKKRVAENEILAITVPPSRLQYLWGALRDFGAPMYDYDFRHPEKCNILGLCILARVNFRIQIYKNGLEGYLGRNLKVWNSGAEPGEWPDDGTAENTAAFNSKFAKFMVRLSKIMDQDLYTHLGRYFPLDQYLPLGVADQFEKTQGTILKNIIRKKVLIYENPSSEQVVLPLMETQSHVPALDERSAKKGRLDPRAAMYQQNFSQTQRFSQLSTLQVQQSLPSQEESQLSQLSENSQDSESAYQDEQGPNILLRDRARVVSSTPGEICFSANEGTEEPVPGSETSTWYSRNVVDFATLFRIQKHTVSTGTSFKTTAKIYSMDPPPEFVFVKPYGRTMKISPFRLKLSQGDDVLLAESLSEEDKCSFFGLVEIEDAIDRIGELTQKMALLIGTETSITVEKRVDTTSTGHNYPYWAIISPLEKIARSLEGA